jgi:hypothetical protein
MIKRKQIETEDLSDTEDINIVPIQDFGYQKDIDESSEEEEQKPKEQRARWSKNFQRRNPRTGEIIGKPEHPAAKFADLEAVHNSCSESETDSSADETDGSLKEFITSENESESSATEKSEESTESSDSEEPSSDSFIELKPTRMNQREFPFDVTEIPRVKKYESRDKMDDLMTIQEGREFVNNGYAFPQSANLKDWYFKG